MARAGEEKLNILVLGSTDSYYADAVEAAFKEVNTRVKGIYKNRTSIEKDGVKLMQSAFSPQNPIIKLFQK